MSRKGLHILIVTYLVGGAVAGLLMGWGWQMQADGCTLADLNPDARRDLLLSVALARPTQRDEVRCAFPGLSDEALADLVEAEAEKAVAGGAEDEVKQALVSLASLFGRQRPDLVVYAATLEPGVIDTPEVTPSTPTPEATPTTDIFPYGVTRLQAACDDTADRHQVNVRVLDETGEGLAGRRVRLEWDGGIDEAMTGIKSPAASGYADFVLETGVSYGVYVVSSEGQAESRAVSFSVTSAGCADGEHALWFVDFARRTESVP